MIYRLISPKWANLPVLEGEFTDEEIAEYNAQGYNIFSLPNYPSSYQRGTSITGADINTFVCVFVDFDLKSGTYSSKEDFVDAIAATNVEPSKLVDSGNGIHCYWNVSDLDAMSYLRFQRRLMRLFSTDEAVGQLFQLMRVPGTINTKIQDKPVECVELYSDDSIIYTSEQLDKLLPPISIEDEAYCQQHYNKTYGINQNNTPIDDTIPAKFGAFLRLSAEAKEIWSGNTDDRSKSDFRLAHLMFAAGFTKPEALSVLVNSGKALSRAPIHRRSYASNIVDKIWTYETENTASPTVRDILSRGEETLKGARFPCNKLIDDTVHGFRLGQVIGIIGGSGVGKTTLTLNTFLWFAEHNPDYHHFFFSLEQPVGEIASRIRTICQGNEGLFDKIHIVSNYGDNGEFKHFSIDSIEEHLLAFQKDTGKKVGACVIDHIGVLAKSDKNGESEGLIGICRRMKAVAVRVNMMLIMLSQAPREKAGIGDLELNKDSAFGTVFFESFLDYCLCLWQPLKRAYSQGAPTVMAIKFAKIRHKKQGFDRIQEDICYQLYFDPTTELLREMTQDEETAAKHFLSVSTNLRKLDKKTDLIPYKSRRVETDEAGPNSTRQS